MMKYCVMIFLLAITVACTPHNERSDESTKNTVKKIPDSLLIKPGKAIGNIQLDSNMEALGNRLGRPNQTDAAMGSALYTWFVNNDTAGYRISTFGHRNFGGADEAIVHIKKILVTDPRYMTFEGLHAGSGQDSIALLYQLKNSHQNVSGSKKINLFADASKGIAFEIDSLSRKCKAVVVFKPGDSASAYINMY